MKLLGDFRHVTLCGATSTAFKYGAAIHLLPSFSIAPKSSDALGTRITAAWLLFYLWLDIHWMLWRAKGGGSHGE